MCVRRGGGEGDVGKGGGWPVSTCVDRTTTSVGLGSRGGGKALFFVAVCSISTASPCSLNTEAAASTTTRMTDVALP